MGKAAVGTQKDLAACPWGKSRKAWAFAESRLKKAFLSKPLPIENPGRELVSMEMLFVRSCADAILKVDSSKVAKVLSEDVSPSACLEA